MLWYTARGAGLAALVLLSLSTCLGALVSRESAAGRSGNPGLRYIGQYLHRSLASLGLVVLLVHVGTLIADSYADVGLTGAIIPFTSGYRTGWVAVGTVAAYTFIAVALLGLARGRMATTPRGARVWRALHSLAYLGWGAAILHGFTAGTDSDVGWVRATYVACLVAVLGSAAYRVAAVLRSRRSTPSTFPRDRFDSPARPARIGASR